jgi:hypothetical protein
VRKRSTTSLLSSLVGPLGTLKIAHSA